MVDFQSRDTRRGPTDDEDPESSAETTASEADGAGDAPPDDGGVEDAEGDRSGADQPTAEGQGAAEPSDDETTDRSTAAERTAEPTGTVDVAVVTVTGDRAALEETVTAAFEAAGHAVVRRERLRGGYDAIQQIVETLVALEGVDAVVTVGGVGLGAEEMAIEAVHPLLAKALPGFGEALRARLADHVGTGIVGVRTTAGVSEGTLVFCLPGDAEVARLAVEEILAVEAPRLAAQLD